MPASKAEIRLAHAVRGGKAKNAKMTPEYADEVIRAARKMSQSEFDALPERKKKRK